MNFGEYINCVIQGNFIEFEFEKKAPFLLVFFSYVIKDPLRNPILGNILIALNKEI